MSGRQKWWMSMASSLNQQSKVYYWQNGLPGFSAAPHPSQTTYEFAASLGAAIPETREPVQALAATRVRERYSPDGVDDDAREAAVIAWHRAATTMLTLLPGRILRFLVHLGR